METYRNPGQNLQSGGEIATRGGAELGCEQGVEALPDDGPHLGDYGSGFALHQFKVAVAAGFDGNLRNFGLYPDAVGEQVPQALFEVPLQGVKVHKFHVHSQGVKISIFLEIEYICAYEKT